LRREADTRFYFDLFQPTAQYVSGLERARMLLTWPRVPESPKPVESKRSALVAFEGMNDLFASILDEHQFVHQSLLDMTRAKHKAALPKPHGAIAVHVRLGDFAQPSAAEPEGALNRRVPLDWYLSQVRALHRVLGIMPVQVFSDGTNEELGPLLALPGVQRASCGSSVADLLALARGRVLVASGSSFSMWASYLGRMPVIWPRGHLRQRLYREQPAAEIEIGENDELPLSFVEEFHPAPPGEPRPAVRG
jgi:hypothetical protein